MRTATRTCQEIQKLFKFDKTGHHQIVNYEDKKDYDIIFNVRSPYSRIVSLFKLFSFQKNDYTTDFNSWLKYIICENQKNKQFYFGIHLDCYLEQIHKPPTYLVKVEFLESDLCKIPLIFDNKQLMTDIFEVHIRKNRYHNEYERYSKNMGTPWQSYYTQELADLVYTSTENQFDIFNYNRNYWKDGTP